jgi:hypothetical protein
LGEVEVEAAEALEQEEVSNDQNFTQICLLLIMGQVEVDFKGTMALHRQYLVSG